jgi:glycosyltransferase involved in cell wall biosynthesis
LDKEKGLTFLIEAVDMLIRGKGMKVKLQIVGRGFRRAEEERLRQEVNKRQLRKHVHFSGYAPHGCELFQLYRDSDIFVLPSLTGEGIPQTIFEAMACGVPIVTARVGGISSLVKDKENGLLISPGSPREIGSAIQLLLNSPELRKKLIINGLSTAKEHTLEAERDRMISHIEAFLEQAQPRLG